MNVQFVPQSRASGFPKTYHIVSVGSGTKVGVIQKFQTKWIGWDVDKGAFRGPFGLAGSPFNTLNQAKAFCRDYYAERTLVNGKAIRLEEKLYPVSEVAGEDYVNVG